MLRLDIGSCNRRLAQWAILICLFVVLIAAKERNPARFQQTEDPNSRYVCQGTLAEYAACQCKADEGEVSCINAQFVDTNVFLPINTFYKNLRQVTFHGNNFQDLPSGSLFGSSPNSNLDVLNISANYIVNLNGNALEGLTNLRVLDLSNNEIVLNYSDATFLKHTPMLNELYLRRAFTATLNRTVQFEFMMSMFREAHLTKLEVLDLSYNFFTEIPFSLPCPFPSLVRLDLRQNFLKTFSVNASCLGNIRTIDLSRNQIHSLDGAFRRFAQNFRAQTFIIRNSFYCNSESRDYINWIRSTNVIRDRDALICDRASPKLYTGRSLLEVPLEKLDKSVDVYSNNVLLNLPWLFLVCSTMLFLLR